MLTHSGWSWWSILRCRTAWMAPCWLHSSMASSEHWAASVEWCPLVPAACSPAVTERDFPQTTSWWWWFPFLLSFLPPSDLLSSAEPPFSEQVTILSSIPLEPHTASKKEELLTFSWWVYIYNPKYKIKAINNVETFSYRKFIEITLKQRPPQNNLTKLIIKNENTWQVKSMTVGLGGQRKYSPGGEREKSNSKALIVCNLKKNTKPRVHCNVTW